MDASFIDQHMQVSQWALASMLALCFILGIILGIVYDLFHSPARLKNASVPAWITRIKRPDAFFSQGCRRKPCAGGVMLLVADIFFFLVCAVALLLLLYAGNSGQFRLSTLAVSSIGFLIYRITLHKIVCLLFNVAFLLLRALFGWIVFILLFPFRRIIRWISPRFAGVIRALKKRWGAFIALHRTKPQDVRSVAFSQKPPHNGKYYFGTKNG